MADRKSLVALQAVTAYMGPRTLDSTQAKFSHVSAGDTGLIIPSAGNPFIVLAAGQPFYIYELTTPPSTFTEMARFLKQGTGAKAFIGGVALGLHPAHGTYKGIWFSGNEAAGQYFAISADDGLNTLINAGSQLGIRINNGGDRFVCTSTQAILDAPGLVFRVNGSSKVTISNTRMDLNPVGLYINNQAGAAGWDYAQIIGQSNGGDNYRISLSPPSCAPQLRGATTEGDLLAAVNLSMSDYAPFKGKAYQTVSTLTRKKDVKTFGKEREQITVQDWKSDTVPDISIMDLKPVTFRSKVPALFLHEDKSVTERDASTILGRQGLRENLGLIAEDVATVIPSAVSYDDNGENPAIDYTQVTVALLEHVQRLTDEVATLRYRIAELESK